MNHNVRKFTLGEVYLHVMEQFQQPFCIKALQWASEDAITANDKHSVPEKFGSHDIRLFKHSYCKRVVNYIQGELCDCSHDLQRYLVQYLSPDDHVHVMTMHAQNTVDSIMTVWLHIKLVAALQLLMQQTNYSRTSII